MSTDPPSADDRELDSAASISGGPSLRAAFLLFGVLCAVFVGAYFVWIHPAMVRTTDALAETRSAQDKLRGEMESSKQQALSLNTAVEAVQTQTATRYEDANREIDDVRNQVRNLEGIVVRTNTLLSQSSSDLGARMAAKVFQKADLIPVLRRAEALSGELDSLREELDDWTKMRAELLAGDRGKAIAADGKLVDRFANIEVPSVTLLEIETWTDVLPLLIKPMQDALERDAPSLIPLDEYTKRVDDCALKIREASASIRKARLAVAMIEEEAHSTRVEADTPTLPEALKDHETRVAKEFEIKLAEEARKKRDALAKQLADEKVKDEALSVKIEIEKGEAQRETLQAKHDSDMKEEEARKRAELASGQAKHEADMRAAARVALEGKFEKELPRIESLLRPFITHGSTQPKGRHFELSTEVGPVSLAKLGATGALERTIEAQQLLYGLTSANRTNDRDLGAFPSYVGGEQDWRSKQATVQRAQELLNEFGPLMVEKGMLAK